KLPGIERILYLRDDYVENLLHEFAGLSCSKCAGLGTGEAAGEGTFEEPSSGAPVGTNRFLHRAKWAKLGVVFRVAELLEEVGVSLGFAANSADGAIDVAGGVVQAAAAG